MYLSISFSLITESIIKCQCACATGMPGGTANGSP